MRTLFKKYIMTVLATMSGIALVLAVAVWWIDPYGELPPRGEIKTFASNVLTARKHLRQLEQSPHILVFGTSRSRFLSTALVGEPVINLHSIYGNPHAVKDFLDRLDRGKIENIVRIVYLLDGHTLEGERLYQKVDYENHVDALFYRLSRARLYMADAWLKVKLNMLSTYTSWIDDKGASHNVIDYKFTGYLRPFDEDRRYVTDDNLKLLAEIDTFCRHNGIEITYVRPVLPVAYLRLLDRDSLFTPLRRLLTALPGGIHDLSYVEGMSEDPDYFYDGTHLNVSGTKKAFPSGRPLGEAVTRETVEAHLGRLAVALDRILQTGER
jgi:hypothetical protein